MTRSYETHLLCGIASVLSAEGFGTFVDPDTGGAYPDGTDRPIYLEASTVDSDRAMWVLLRDTVLLPNNGQTTEVQIITREPAHNDAGVQFSQMGAFDFAAQVAEFLTPRGLPASQWQFGTVPTSRVERYSLGSLGRDQNGRPQTSQNYRIRGRRFTV